LRKNSFVFILAVAIVFFILFLFTGCSTTVASVNGIKIKQGEVESYLDFLKNQNPDATLYKNEEDLKVIDSVIINSLIDTRLLEGYADKNEIDISKEEVNEQFEKIVSSYPSQDAFKKDLKDKEISTKFLKSELENQILINKIFKEITKCISVSSAQVEEYYKENKETLFKVPERIKISHILVEFSSETETPKTDKKSRDEALDEIKYVKAQLEEGEEFEKLAEKYSDDKLSSTNGGDLGYVSRGQLIKELEEVAFSLDIGEVSEVVETSYGFHIIKITDKQEEFIRDFKDVEDTIKSYLEDVSKKEKWEEFVNSLRDEADIQYYTDMENSSGNNSDNKIKEGK